MHGGIATGSKHACNRWRRQAGAAIRLALDAGGDILLDQGVSPTVVLLDQTLNVSKNVTLDGGGLNTLDGNNMRRILLITRRYRNPPHNH